MEVICKRVCGLDVHKKIIVATIIVEDNDGKLTEETQSFGTLPSELAKLINWLKMHRIELSVMESTGVFWKPVYAQLEAHHLQAFVVNAQHIKNVPGRKTDVTDSQWLAMLARCGLLRGSFIADKALRELRQNTRYRIKLQQMISQQKNRLHKILDAEGFCVSAIVSDISGLSGQAIIMGLIEGHTIASIVGNLKGAVKKKAPQLQDMLSKTLSPNSRFLLQRITAHIGYMEKERDALDAKIVEDLEPYKQHWYLLQTIPGMNKWSAAGLIAEFGIDMKRFGNVKQFCAWAGMCPGNNESAGKRKSGRKRKGNSFIGTLLCEVANAAIKTNSQFKDKHKTLMIRRGYKRSVIAIGHKILRVIYCLFTTGKHYQDPGIDYKALVVKRNGPRWMKELANYGFAIAANKGVRKKKEETKQNIDKTACGTIP